MSLLVCPECQNKVSEHADKCPACGCPIQLIKEKSKKEVVIPEGYTLIKNVLFKKEEIENIMKKNLGELYDYLEQQGNINDTDVEVFSYLVRENNNEIPTNYDAFLEETRQRNSARLAARLQKKMYCPRCGSINVEEMVYAPLPYIRREYWHCNNCHFEFEEH